MKIEYNSNNSGGLRWPVCLARIREPQMIRPLGCIESGAKRANRQAGSGSDFPSSDRAPGQSVTPDQSLGESRSGRSYGEAEGHRESRPSLSRGVDRSPASSMPSSPSRYDTTPPRPQDLASEAEYEAALSRIEKAAAGIAAILALLPREDRALTVGAVLKGLEGVNNG